MHRHKLKRFETSVLYNSTTPIGITNLKALVNDIVNNPRTELDRDELRQLLILMADSITTAASAGGNFITVSVTAPAGVIAIAADRAIDYIIIQSPLTQLVSIGNTVGGTEFFGSYLVTGGVDEVLSAPGAWYKVAGSLHITCVSNLTIKYHLI